MLRVALVSICFLVACGRPAPTRIISVAAPEFVSAIDGPGDLRTIEQILRSEWFGRYLSARLSISEEAARAMHGRIIAARISRTVAAGISREEYRVSVLSADADRLFEAVVEGLERYARERLRQDWKVDARNA